MANKIKENNTLYIRRCKHCKSLFGYTNLEWAKDDYYYDKGTIKCPYCNNKNKIRFKIRYKSVKKIEEDYKSKFEESEKDNESLKRDIKSLEIKYNEQKLEINLLSSYKIKYEGEKKKCTKLNNELFEVKEKISKINTYIDNYMNSPKKNNLATKYIKEIQELTK